MVQVNGDALALAMLHALGDYQFESQEGYCERFIREVVESVYPDAPFDQCFLASASASMLAFSDGYYNSLVVTSRIGQPFYPSASTLRAGDLLYKGEAATGGDPSGHVGMFFHQEGQNGTTIAAVGENSSFHTRNPGTSPLFGQVQGAKGWRALSVFGPVEMVVRLSGVQ